MEPVGSELYVMLRDPQLRQVVLNQPESECSAEARGTEASHHLLVHAVRVLASHVARNRPAVDLIGRRHGLSVH
jgi:hypothetical protein